MKEFLKRFKIPLLLVLSGAITALPLVVPELGMLQWVSVIPAAAVLIKSASSDMRSRGIYWRGLLYFWAYYAVCFHWFFYMYPLDFAGLSPAAAVFVILLACFGLSLFQAAQSAFAFVIFAAVARQKRITVPMGAMPLLAGAIFVVFEWWQTVGWWGVPWGRLPIGQINSPLFLRSSALFGSYFVTFVIIAVNFYLAYAIINAEARRKLFACAIGAFAVNLALCGCVTLFSRDGGETVRVAAVQGNLSSSEKWGPTSLYRSMEIYGEYTLKAAEEGAQAVILPETAFPYNFYENETIVEFLSSLAKEADVSIFVGAFTEGEGGSLYNSMFEVRSDGTYSSEVYSKQKLVPFGEYVPWRPLISKLVPPLAEIGKLEEDLLCGESGKVMHSDVGVVGGAICFDTIYENVVLDGVRHGAQVIFAPSNDSWFADSAALEMHNSQLTLRAIETGRYAVHATNTGKTSVRDHLGNTVAEMDSNTEGYIVADVRLSDSRTLYSYIGNAFAYLCIGFAVALPAVDAVLKRRGGKS